MTLDQALTDPKGQYHPLLRAARDGLVPAISVTTDGADVGNGVVLTAFNIRYADRVILHVTPTSQTLPVKEMLGEEFSPNEKGETRFNFETSTRGLPAVGREAGTQVWRNGETSDYPAVLTWVERTDTGQLVEYQLVGDGPVADLMVMAESMRGR